jgi:hypothetical protein
MNCERDSADEQIGKTLYRAENGSLSANPPDKSGVAAINRALRDWGDVFVSLFICIIVSYIVTVANCLKHRLMNHERDKSVLYVGCKLMNREHDKPGPYVGRELVNCESDKPGLYAGCELMNHECDKPGLYVVYWLVG